MLRFSPCELFLLEAVAVRGSGGRGTSAVGNRYEATARAH
jgi:hypothetical protein